MRYSDVFLMIGLSGAATACAGSTGTDSGPGRDAASDAPAVTLDARTDTSAEISVAIDVVDSSTDVPADVAADALDDTGTIDVASADDATSDTSADANEDVASADLGPCMDLDGDGYGIGPGCRGPDCDDTSADIHPGAPEVCNNIDDDCSSRIDEGLGSIVCGVGACMRTVPACRSGVVQRCSPGSASPEVCNGLDDDCDGVADDGFGQRTCGIGACSRTVDVCVAGVLQTCTPGPTRTEICNAMDDDCDGSTDEAISPQTCGVGACTRTAPGCSGGTVPACVPAPPAAETCNGADDDCDATADDGCPNAITLTGRFVGPRFGGTAGSISPDSCPVGSAVVGYAGRYTTNITSLGLICARVSLVELRTTMPFAYSVTTGIATPLPQRGTAFGTLWNFVCPTGSVITGIRGTATTTAITGLAFTCSRINVTGMPGSFTTSTSASGTSPFFGAMSGSLFTFTCPGNNVNNETLMYWGPYINGVQPVCTTPTLMLR